MKSETEECHARVLLQKNKLESLIREYVKDTQTMFLRDERFKAQRDERDARIEEIRERKFEQELLLQQEALKLKRESQQEFIARQVFKIAADLEKAKLVDEKREYREMKRKKEERVRLQLVQIENQFKREKDMKMEQIEAERYRRKVEMEAQRKVLS